MAEPQAEPHILANTLFILAEKKRPVAGLTL
jgi:hypothetical protein